MTKKAQQQQIGHEKVKTTLQYPMRSKVCDVYKLVISQLKTNLYLMDITMSSSLSHAHFVVAVPFLSACDWSIISLML